LELKRKKDRDNHRPEQFKERMEFRCYLQAIEDIRSDLRKFRTENLSQNRPHNDSDKILGPRPDRLELPFRDNFKFKTVGSQIASTQSASLSSETNKFGSASVG
jgi:hypothetical protein